MKALSVIQPWPWAMIHQGKRVENRTWFTHYRGPLAIHASSTRLPLYQFPFVLPDDSWSPLRGDLVYGAIVAICRLVDCTQQAKLIPDEQQIWCDLGISTWWWLLAELRPLPVPIRCKGARGLFDVPDVDGVPVAPPGARASTPAPELTAEVAEPAERA
jgi:hypothetical protein